MDTVHEQLDGSFGNGPALRPVDDHVAAGRRALRRHRVRNGVAGLAAAGVLAVVWSALAATPGPGSTPDQMAAEPTPTHAAGPTHAADPDPAPEPWPRGELLRYVDGELEVRPGVVVHEHIPNPYGFRPPQLSDALDVTWKGRRQWLMIEKGPSGITSSASTPSNGWASFADYVADQIDVNSGRSGWPETFELDDRGRVVATPGTRVHNRTDDPRLGPEFAAPGTTTGAAVVSVSDREPSYFVVWRVVDGRLDVITTPPGDVVGATFDELLSGARARYASGEGLR